VSLRAEPNNPDLGALTWDVDPERHVTVLRLAGDLDGQAVRTRIEAFWDTHPKAIANHCIVDMRSYTGDLGYDDLTMIARQWRKVAAGRDAGRGTAIVTNDRFARLLMRAVALLFPTRRFALFAEMDEATQWLGTISQESSPNHNGAVK
jgi:hypothetical protein